MKTIGEVLALRTVGRHGEHNISWSELLMHCESPIETLMADAFRTVATDRRIDLRAASPRAARSDLAVSPGVFWLIPQRKIGRYRADFVLYCLDELGNQQATVIECDGRDFHSGERVERDRERDREMMRLGFAVRRYSGAAIYAMAEEFVSAIFDCVLRTTTVLLGHEFPELVFEDEDLC